MKARVGAAVVAVAAIWLVSACTTPVTDLGGASSEAYDINDAGAVVGVSELEGSSVRHAFKRLPDNSAVDLGTLPGDTTSFALEINEHGTVIGQSDSQVVRWDPAGQITDLGFVGAPWDLNDAGVVVGFDLVTSGSTERRAFVYDPAVGAPVALPELAGTEIAYAWGLNETGQAVGTNGIDGEGVPVRWDLASGTVTDLRSTGLTFASDIADDGTIVGTGTDGGAAIWKPGDATATSLGAANAVAVTLNRSGTVVGHTFTDPTEAFRWDAGAGLVWLGTEGADNTAYAINGSGGIVGFSAGKAAFLYPQ